MFSAATKTGGQASAVNYIDDVFSAWLYTGTNASQSINNGIDLASKGGLTWVKNRTSGTAGNVLTDTVRGVNSQLASNTTSAAANYGAFSSFNNNGFTVYTSDLTLNATSNNYASWTFRKQPKFFDVVTYTGTGSARTIAHNLDSVPGMIIVKRTDTTTDWQVYHRSLSNTEYIVLNTTSAKATGTTRWNSATPTSSVFSLGTDTTVNASGGTYVAYLFAHDAGGFGASGSDNIISCGSFTTDASGAYSVNLGYEPQYVLVKATSTTGNWLVIDNLRRMAVNATNLTLSPNLTSADTSFTAGLPSATGFYATSGSPASDLTPSATYIYMAIRRPMKPPTSGTEVFSPVARAGTGANATVSSGFVTDTVIEGNRTSTTAGTKFGAWNRLRGTGYNITNTTAAEVAAATTIIQANPWDLMDGYKVGTTSTLTNASSNTFINWMFKRASGFHDVVCYTGTGSATTVAHNLTVAPELMIVKGRGQTQGAWITYSASLGETQRLFLYTTAASSAAGVGTWNNTAPTSSVFSVGTSTDTNGSTFTYVAYLFATVAGVSKVGSYTGTGATQTINCGFTGGARFVLIKRTDSSSDWFVWDTARGMVSGTDPSLSLNTTAAEVNANSVYTATTGFQLLASPSADVNTSGGSYIFLAIA